MTGTVFNFRNLLLFLGILLASLGTIFFATEYIARLEPWTRVAAMVLLATIFVSLGRHFEEGPGGAEILDRRGWRWFRVPTALYILGLVAAFAAVIVFFSIEEVDRLIKVAVTILVGLGLILFAGRRFGTPPVAPKAPE